MIPPKHICLITSSQPSTNPRLVKEADALADAGYEVTVIHTFMTSWAQKADRQLAYHKKWNARQVGGDPYRQRLTWYWTRLRNKLAKLYPKLLPFKLRALCRPFDELLQAAKTVPADLYIAHTLEALPVAYYAAKANNKPIGFDIEDFHRAEETQPSPDREALKIFVESKYLPKVDYRTAASPLIGATYADLFKLPDIPTLLNVFPIRFQPAFRPTVEEEPLKLFWFSQTVGQDRGLEDVLQALEKLPGIRVQLTILGKASDEVKWYFRSALKSPEHEIQFLDPVPPTQIFEIAAGQDVGLALERRKPFNRDICLTNKIFTYLLAGNAVLATATQAQKAFMEEYQGVGLTYLHGDIDQLAQWIEGYAYDRNTLQHTRQRAWQLAHDHLNWETEQQKLLEIIKGLL